MTTARAQCELAVKPATGHTLEGAMAPFDALIAARSFQENARLLQKVLAKRRLAQVRARLGGARAVSTELRRITTFAKKVEKEVQVYLDSVPIMVKRGGRWRPLEDADLKAPSPRRRRGQGRST